MDSMYSLIDIIVLGAGLYLLYAWYLLKYKGEIRESVLLPKGIEAKKCKDLDGYAADVSPKVLVYGLVTAGCGALGIVDTQWGFLGNYYLIIIGIFLVVTVWYTVQSKKAVKKYWP